MPSTSEVDVPQEAADVASRYRRLERPISGAVAAFVGLLAAAAFVWLPLPQAAVVAVVTLVAFRVPVFESGGRARLVTEADPADVQADFDGTTPPPLALSWGIADTVRRTDDGVAYDVSYLFGIRSTTMGVKTRSADGSEGLEVVVTADGRPWATYSVSIAATGDRTVIDICFRSDRRFGLRRLPQWLVAERYREAALAAQGYVVEERDVGLSI